MTLLAALFSMHLISDCCHL